MVTRTSQDVQFNQGGRTQVAGTQSGYVAPDVQQFMTTQAVETPRIGPSSTDRVLSSLLQVTGKLADQAVQVSREEAYLAGAAQASTIKSESELQTNIATSDWTTAGYRDTVGRLKAASIEAEIAEDMPQQREKSPEEFATYLAGKRNDLMGSLEGMSLQQRKAMFQQTLLNERAAIKKHGAEHYKFILETENKSIRSAIYAANTNMNTAKLESPNGSAVEVYNAAVDAAYGTANSSIVNNPKLPPQAKAKLLEEFAAAALDSDNYALFLKMQNTNTALPDGTQAPMLSMVLPEDQIKLSGMYRESLKRTEGLRNMQYQGDMAKMLADWENPTTPLQSEKDVLRFLETGIRNKVITDEKYRETLQQYYKLSEKKATQGSLANAFAVGDQRTMLALGKTRTEGLKAFVEANAARMTQPQLVDQLFTVGVNTQQEEAFKEVGYILAPAFAQLGNRETMSPDAAAGVAQTLQRLDAAEQAGLQGAYASFLSAFQPEVQTKIGYIREQLKARVDPVTAITTATARVLEEAKMEPAMRAALAQTKANDRVKAVQDIQPRDLWDTAVLGVKSLFSADAAAKLDLTVRQKWGESSLSANNMMQQARLEYSKALDQIASRSPGLGPEELKSAALADVKARTINLAWGPLVVPQGFTPQSYFGTERSTPNDRIASALTEYLKPAPGNRATFTIGVNGQLAVQEMNADGVPVKAGMLVNPKEVAKLVGLQQDKLNSAYQQNFGAGVSRPTTGGVVRYNGDNTANVDNPLMRQFRDDLADLGALDSISSTKLDPKAPKATVDAARQAAYVVTTNDAAKLAKRFMAGTQNQSDAAFKFFGALSYQGGTDVSKSAEYRPLLLSIQRRNLGEAEVNLHSTKAYKDADVKAKQYYDTQLKLMMR